MKIVINNDFGGFDITEQEAKMLGVDRYKALIDADNFRTNPDLVGLVKSGKVHNQDLVVVDIPEEATDWMIVEYDGYEVVHYVMDGKIFVKNGGCK